MKDAKYIAIYLVIVIIINIFMPVTIAVDTVNEIENDNTTKTTEESDIDNKIEENTIENKAQSSNNYEQNETQKIEPEKELENKQGQEDITLEMKHGETINDTEEPLKKIDIDEQLETINITNSSETVETGVYKIKSFVGDNKYLDIDGGKRNDSANLQIWEQDKVAQQEFLITKLNDGYKIEAIHSNKVLDVAGGSQASGANVQQYTNNNTIAQRWSIVSTGEADVVNIISNCDQKYLDILGGVNSNGANVQVYDGNGTNAQKFKLEKVEVLDTENKVFKINSKVGVDRCLDIDGGSKNDNANLQIWNSENVSQQKFRIAYLNNGYYKIVALHSDKALDVDNGGIVNGTNVKQYKDYGSEAQQWYFKKTGNNEYSIISKCNNLCLDIAGGSSANGANIQMYSSNGTNAQKFSLEETSPPEKIEGTESVTSMKYKIATAINENQVIDIDSGSSKQGANVQIWNSENVQQQVFELSYNGDGTYTIKAPYARNKVFDVDGGKQDNGTNVSLYWTNGTNAQKWIVHPTGDGYYNIISVCNGLYLDTAGGSVSNGTNIQTNNPSGRASQKFKLKPYEEIKNPTMYNGTYRITTALRSDMALDVNGGYGDDGTNVQIWTSTYVLQQKCIVTHLGDNYYTIEFAHSRKALEAKPDGNVVQNTKNGSDAQKWRIVDAGNGYYSIISKLNGKCLDISGGNTADGTNVQVYDGNGTDAQKFKFEEMYFGIDVSHWQPEIDFNSITHTGAVDFMILGLGYYDTPTATFHKDVTFEKNYENAKAYGIPRGAYLFSYADSVEDAKAEAREVKKVLEGKDFQLPIFFDVEAEGMAGRSRELQTQMSLAFCEELKAAGYKVGIYSNLSWFETYIDINKIPIDYSLWIAAYGGNDGYVPRDVFRYAGNHDIWQYTSTGRISGISDDVDINIAYKRMF